MENLTWDFSNLIKMIELFRKGPVYLDYHKYPDISKHSYFGHNKKITTYTFIYYVSDTALTLYLYFLT